MLEDLSKYTNLGTPQYFKELFNQFKARKGKWTIHNINEHFSNRMIDGRVIFDGCIPMLLSIKFFKKKKGKILICKDFFLNYQDNKEYLSNKILEKIFLEFKEDVSFNEIFSQSNISYDVIYKYILINNSAFRFKFASFKQLLIDLDFLTFYSGNNLNKLIINPKYRKLFDLNILPLIKKRKFNLIDLYKQLEQKKINGNLAEDFVLDFEKSRLGKQKYSSIEKISEYDVAAGYDILSFESKNSLMIDRFIEVKGYTKNVSFYWSRNEIDVSKIKKDNYYIYLVDINKIENKNYIPIIIKNPFLNVLNNKKWNKCVENFFITENN